MNVPEQHRAVAHAWVDGAIIIGKLKRDNLPLERIYSPSWADDWHYEVMPTPNNIDWSHVDEKYVAHAMDRSGKVFLYEAVPKPLASYWGPGDGCVSAAGFKSLTIGTTEWRDSLVLRPKDE